MNKKTVLWLALIFLAVLPLMLMPADEVNEAEIKNLIKGLASSSDETINRSANALMQIGQTVIPYLAEAYAKPVSARQRQGIIFTAVCLEDKDISELLLKYLEDEQKKISDYYDALMRAEARRPKNDIFGDPNDSNVRPPQPSSNLRVLVIDKLGKLRDTKAIPLFLKTVRASAPNNSALKSSELIVKQRITRMLSRFVNLPEPDPIVVGALLELMNDKDTETVRWALYGLKRAGYQASPEQAKKLLASYDAGILEYTLALLENSKDDLLAKLFKKHLDNSSPFIRSDARAVQRVISGEQPVITPTIKSEELPLAKDFSFPLREYLKGGERKSFGAKIDEKMILRPDAESFSNSIHLGDDCGWYQDGAPIYAIADGVVRVSSRSTTFKDDSGRKHWAWGNLLVIEHKISESKTKDKPEPQVKYICSLYAHLSNDILVKEGELVKKGQKIGAIGMGFSPENGDYEAHLHFSIYDGPFYYTVGTKVPLGSRVLEIIEVKEPGIYLAWDEPDESSAERRKWLLLEFSTNLGVSRTTSDMTGLSSSQIDDFIAKYRGDPNSTSNYASWISGYASIESGTTGWIDPLKFLQSKVR